MCGCNQWRNLDSSANDKIVDLSKLKAFAVEKLNVSKKMISVCDKVENMVGKGNQHFLLFQLCFQKLSISGSLKVGIVW